MWRAEEFEQLAEGEEWAAAHQLLLERLAPAWLLSEPGGLERLREAVQTLESHAADIDAAGGSGRAGAGLYGAYLALKARRPSLAWRCLSGCEGSEVRRGP